MILIINMLLVPLLLSWVHHDRDLPAPARRHAHVEPRLWHALSRLTERRRALVVAGIAPLLLAWGYLTSNKRADRLICSRRRRASSCTPTPALQHRHRRGHSATSIGVDLLTVITEVPAQACTDHAVMSVIDRFEWEMRNVPGVQSVVALPTVAAADRGLERGQPGAAGAAALDTSLLAQAVTYASTPPRPASFNGECSVMPVLIFTTDHKAQTIDRIVAEVKAYQASPRGNP